MGVSRCGRRKCWPASAGMQGASRRRGLRWPRRLSGAFQLVSPACRDDSCPASAISVVTRLTLAPVCTPAMPGIPENEEQSTGMERKEELKTPDIFWSREPITGHRGTKENPAIVPSYNDSRVVGLETESVSAPEPRSWNHLHDACVDAPPSHSPIRRLCR